MKKALTIFLFLLYSNLQGQDLKNTEWIQVKEERKDGSRIIERQQNDKLIFKYYFKEKSVAVSINNQFTQELKYSLNQNILSIGEFVKFKVDTIDTEILVLTEIPKIELTDDKINRYTFVNQLYIFQYLKENKQLEIIGDSLIEYNIHLFPTCKRNITQLFMTELGSNTENKILRGSFIINSTGDIKNIRLDSTDRFSRNQIKEILKVLNSTSGEWIMPPTPKAYQYKTNFTLRFANFEPLFGINFSFEPIGLQQESQKRLTEKEKSNADRYYNKGVEFINSGKFEKASIQFIKSIEIDSLNVDSYYNLAFCYQKLGNKNMACETWAKLKEMGQKQGEYLYDQNCK